jgi:beta-lactamase class C
MSNGALSSEAYGIKSTVIDVMRFVEANMNMVQLDGKLQRAMVDTHIGYYKAGPMTQDLIWEQYPYPVALKMLPEGNSQAMSFNATPVTEINPPEAPQRNVWTRQNGLDPWLRGVRGVRPGETVGYRHSGEREFAALAWKVRADGAHVVAYSSEKRDL